MPVITALEVHQRNKERVRLFLDDEYALDLPLLQAASLRRGQCLTANEVAALVDAEAVQSAVDRALHYLSYRPRSSEEVRRQLVKKKIPEAHIAAAIERLKQRGYLDDLAFARFWISNRDRFKPMAPRALRYELRQKGIDEAIIDSSLAEIDADDSAYRAAEVRLSRYQGCTHQEFRHKLGAMLRRRGFGTETINDVLLRLQAELAASNPGYFNDENEG